MVGRSPVGRGGQGLKRSGTTDGYGVPLGRALADANRHDSPLLAPALDRLDDLRPSPDEVREGTSWTARSTSTRPRWPIWLPRTYTTSE